MCAHDTEVIASCSELLSLHCPRHPLFHAQLPAWGVSQVIMRQETSAYAEEPLRTVGLLEAAHQYSLQDIRRSAHTPITLQRYTRWQFTNLLSILPSFSLASLRNTTSQQQDKVKEMEDGGAGEGVQRCLKEVTRAQSLQQ